MADFFFRHTWVMFIVVTIVNCFILKYRSQKFIDENPDLRTGYDKIFKTFLIYGNIPWVIIGMGDLTSQTHNISVYFNPRSFNPFVLAFHFSIIVIWVLCARWIYFKNGADFLVQHPGIIYVRGLSGSVTPTATTIKLFFALALLGGIAGMLTMWLVDLPALQGK